MKCSSLKEIAIESAHSRFTKPETGLGKDRNPCLPKLSKQGDKVYNGWADLATVYYTEERAKAQRFKRFWGLIACQEQHESVTLSSWLQ